MSDTSVEPDSPIVMAIKAICPSVKAFSYGRKSDFIQLWSWVKEPSGCEGPIVVVADDIPLADNYDPQNWGNYISSSSWAFAFSLSFLDRGESVPDTMILVTSTNDSCQIDIQTACCGIKVFKLKVTETELEATLSEFAESLIGKTSEAKEAEILEAGKEKLGQTAKSLRDEWVTKMLSGATHSSKDRHDVSNQLGAMIMRAGLTEGMRPDWSSRPHQEWAASLCVERLLSVSPVEVHLVLPQGTKVALVDDRYDEGYLDVVSVMLGCEVSAWRGVLSQNEYDWAVSEPKYVLGLPILEDASQSRFFPDVDLLFLDLRLWSGKDEDERREREKKTLNQYSAIAKFLESTLDSSCLREALKGVLGALSRPNSHRGLAMLPFIITALDPSLPIILFSSTQHRSVIQAVRGFPNIITDFAKPYIGSDDPDAADPIVVMCGLRSAVEKAVELVEVRHVWKEAVKQWNEEVLGQLKQSPPGIWPPLRFEGETLPTHWLQIEWLPLAQEGKYVAAAASAWQFLHRVLGPTRLAHLEEKAGEVSARIKFIKKAWGLGLVVWDKSALGNRRKTEREIAIRVGESMIALFTAVAAKPEATS